MARPPADVLLLDFDGVLRHHDPQHAAALEQSHGLPSGTILATAMHWPRQQPAITGRQFRTQWLDSIAAELAGRVGGVAAAQKLVRVWDADRGELDGVVLDFVREVRAAGRLVGLATNATDDLHQDLERFGLTDEFDAVLSSYRLGVHKPTSEYFLACCQAMAAPPDRCLLVDDADRNVSGARAAGLSAHRWSGSGDLPYLRAALGLPIQPHEREDVPPPA